MATYYVGSGGDNGNNGTTWALRKATLNGAEDIPVSAGDTVYVGPGTYRELLTCDVSGSAGSPISYIGDYTGANTDGVGGVVRITGSDNDSTRVRASSIVGSAKDYRTFQNFVFDACTGSLVDNTNGDSWTIDKCAFYSWSGSPDLIIQSTALNNTVSNCLFIPAYGAGPYVIRFTHSSVHNDSGHVVSNCIIIGGSNANQILSDKVGGITVKNCLLFCGAVAVRVNTALDTGQVMTVNNCIIYGAQIALRATTTAEFVENYNLLLAQTPRSNVNVGANSIGANERLVLFDTRWFFELVTNTAGPNSPTQVISPFDLASYSQLIDVAGTSPTTTDMRGTSAINSVREWGALEYDSTLKIEGAVVNPPGWL